MRYPTIQGPSSSYPHHLVFILLDRFVITRQSKICNQLLGVPETFTKVWNKQNCLTDDFNKYSVFK